MYTIIGFQKVDFTDRVTGARITGHSIYVTRPNENIIGVEAKKFFIKSSIDTSKFLKVGATVDIFFNENGKIESIIERKTI